MARPRRRRNQNMTVPTKSAMTHRLCRRAEHTIASLCQETITATVPFVDGPEFLRQLINAMFNQNTQRILREAKDLVATTYSLYYGAGDVSFHPIPEACLTVGNWRAHGMATPSDEAVKYDPDAPGMDAFQKALRKAVHIADDFAVVKQVVNWLDLNALAGAIRYYFPSVLSLLPPDQDKIPREIPSRYIEPDGIAPYIPLLREASGTVAAALLLPTENLTPDEPLGITVTIVQGGVTRNGITCPRDSVIINL